MIKVKNFPISSVGPWSNYGNKLFFFTLIGQRLEGSALLWVTFPN